jgi:hypothetical protein
MKTDKKTRLTASSKASKRPRAVEKKHTTRIKTDKEIARKC